MGRKGENIFKRKDGRYEARYIKGYNNNRAIYGYVYDKTYSAVKKKRNSLLLTLSIKNNIEKHNSDIETLCIKFLNSLSVKDSSYNRYLSLINNHILPYFKNHKISKDNLNDFISEGLSRKSLSRNTIHDIGTLLKQILNYNNINISFKIPSKIQNDINLFTENEQKLIENEILSKNNTDLFGILFCLYTGLRIGELCALTFENIDLEKEIVIINKTLIRTKTIDLKKSDNKTKVILSTPKSKKSIREIPINNRLIPYLKIYKERNDEHNYFLTEKKEFIEPRSYYNHYLKFLSYLNIQKHTFHALRHTFGTNCIEKGIDPKVLSTIMGHSNVSITLNLYVHPTMKMKKKSLNLL